ncbi:MAG: hypothetical protein PVI50_00535 [Gammaproteobacteria bacterium]
MKIRTLISSTLLAAGLGLGITAPVQAHDSVLSLWRLDRDYHPYDHHDRYYYGDRHHHKHFRKHSKRHHKRHHDHYAWRHHDDGRHDRHHDDRRRGHDRHDGHGGYRRH